MQDQHSTGVSNAGELKRKRARDLSQPNNAQGIVASKKTRRTEETAMGIEELSEDDNRPEITEDQEVVEEEGDRINYREIPYNPEASYEERMDTQEDLGLSRLTLSQNTVVPLVEDANHLMEVVMVRLKHNERLCFHGRIRLRVFEGGGALAHGAMLLPSKEYHTLYSPFSSSALVVDAKVLTKGEQRSMKEKTETKGKELVEGDDENMADKVEEDDEDDKEIKNVLKMLRKEESKGKGKEKEKEKEADEKEGEVVLILKTVMKKREAEEEGSGGWVGPSLPLIERLFIDIFQEEERQQQQPQQQKRKKGKQKAQTIITEMLQKGYSNTQKRKAREMWLANPGQRDTFFRIPGFYMIYDWTMPTTQSLVMPETWHNVAESVLSQPPTEIPYPAHHHQSQEQEEGEGQQQQQPQSVTLPPSVLVCGAKNLGKSTFAKYMINSLLNRYDAVAYIETDMGQCEFTPEGIISLHIITKPVTGPSLIHLMEPIKAVYFGDFSVEDESEYYLQGVSKVFDYYFHELIVNRRLSLPLVVNTQGWIQGLGYHTLLTIAQRVRPKHIVHMCQQGDHIAGSSEIPFLYESQIPDMQMNPLGYIPVVHALPFIPLYPPRISIGAAERRNLALMGYFAGKDHTQLLTQQPPYSIHWGKLRLKVLHREVDPSQIMYALNASVVGLCADDTPYDSCNQGTIGDQPEQLPSFLVDNPICDCIGLGLVRAIDVHKKVMYVLSPVSLDRIKRVNTLLKGTTPLPALMMLQGGSLKAPYLASDSLSTGVASTMRARGGTLQRRRNVQTIK